MPSYQGRALRPGAPRRRTGTLGRITRVLQAVAALVVAAALAHVPWGTLRHRAISVARVQVSGLHYLDDSAVVARSGLGLGDGWLDANLDEARQRLLADSRIRAAKVVRAFPNAIEIRIEERTPVLLVRHGSPWELDADGVLLAPLREGVVADVPLVAGLDAERYAAGTCVSTPEVQRALAWVKATADAQLELAGRISEFDVSDEANTAIVLMDGTRVIAPAWPPGLSTLSSLRVVLADLGKRGMAAREVDLRYRNQVIVRPAASGPGTGAGPGAS